MSTQTTPPPVPTPSSFDVKKIAGKVPQIIAWIVITIMVLVAIKGHKERRHQSQQVERQVENNGPAEPSVVHVPAGTWHEVYPDIYGNMKILPIQSGITCAFRINDDTKEWVSQGGQPIDLTALNPGVRIWKVGVKPDKDAAFLTTR